MRPTSDNTMEPTTEAFAPLADRPPFDEQQDDELHEGPTQPVADVLTFAAEQGLSVTDFVELALCSIEAVSGELFAEVEADGEVDPTTAATLERLQIAAQILSDVSLFDDDEDGEEGDGEGEEDWEGEEDGEAA